MIDDPHFWAGITVGAGLMLLVLGELYRQACK